MRRHPPKTKNLPIKIFQNRFQGFTRNSPGLRAIIDLFMEKDAAREGSEKAFRALNAPAVKLPGFTSLSCQEDIEARAISIRGEVIIIPGSFYAVFIEDIMEHCKHAYTF